MTEQKLYFYQQLFNENIFLVPERETLNVASQQSNQNITAPHQAAEEINGDTLPTKKYRLLGDNKKGLVIAVSVAEPEFIVLSKNDFLIKLLGAIKHTLADVAFINLSKGERLNIFDLAKETGVNHVIAFGQNLIDMSADSKVSLYKPASIGKVPLLIAEPISNIELDINKKKLLWSGLQTIFLESRQTR